MSDTTAGNIPVHDNSLAPELEELLRELVQDWNSGEPRPLRAYLDRRPALIGRPEVIVELINQEVVLRRMRGETPRPADYVAEFPELTDSLESLFELHALDSDIPGRVEGTMIRSPSAGLLDARPARARLSVLPGYEIERFLGRGGMGVVYLARQEGLGRRIALKLLQETRQDDPGLVARFRREAEAVARCQHPNLVQIHEIGEHGGELYLALEYVAGGHLGGAWPECPNCRGRRPSWLRPWPAPSTTPTPRAWSIATSSRPTSCSPPTDSPRSPTSAWRRSRTTPPTPSSGPCWARSPTCRPSRSRRGRTTSAPVPTFTPWVRSSTKP